MKQKFKITYTDPDTNEECVEVCEFEDYVMDNGDILTAEEWVEDYAYTRADKGPHKVEEIKQRRTI